MGLFDFIKFKNKNPTIKNSFEVINGYKPIFFNKSESVYENNLVRYIINSISTDCSKANLETTTNDKKINYLLQVKPNLFSTSSQFVRRIITLLLCDNNAFILPIYDEQNKICELIPIPYSRCELIKFQGIVYAKLSLQNGNEIAVEYNNIGHLKRMQNSNDFFGENNNPLLKDINLIELADETTEHSLKNGATVRFIAKMTTVVDDEEITRVRNEFAKSNFSKSNKSDLVIYDNRFNELKPIDSKAIFLDVEQIKRLEENILKHFNTTSKSIKKEFISEFEAIAYYSGVIEPLLVELCEVLQILFFSKEELENGSRIISTSNRLQFVDYKTKIEFTTSLYDRGIITGNTVCEILNLPKYEEGDKHYIRKEYAEISVLGKEGENEK